MLSSQSSQSRSSRPLHSPLSFRSARSSLLFAVVMCCVGTTGITATSAQARRTTTPTTSTVALTVDATKNRHVIPSEIYGLEDPNPANAVDTNVGVVRYGGNHTTTYNWENNSANRASDFFFESIAYASPAAGEYVDSIVASAFGAGAPVMVTIPTIGFAAKLGDNRSKLCSFSTLIYGVQQSADGICGNGVTTSGTKITGNNPLDAYISVAPDFQQNFVQHLVDVWGRAADGGVQYYILDNEPSIWHQTHRDVHPRGLGMDETVNMLDTYSDAIKAMDPTAKVVGPEEWGWFGYFFSGKDQEAANIAFVRPFPDEAAHNGAQYLPYVLSQLKQRDVATGERTLDVFSVHFYPQGGEFSDDTSSNMQLLRNRSTRALWDRSYVNESWINEPTFLIPLLRDWVNQFYFPDTKIAITEYNWGAKNHMNGATTQADILGIFGRESLDLGSIFQFNNDISPSTTVYKAFKMYRNYDGAGSTFGDTSIQAVAPNPDNVSVFAAERSTDGAYTVMVINKQLTTSTRVQVSLNNTPVDMNTPAQVIRLASNAITSQAGVPLVMLNGGPAIDTTVPAQSVSLFVVKRGTTVGVNTGGGTTTDPAPTKPGKGR